MIKLNFDLYTSEDRAAYVNEFVTHNPSYIFSANELKTISDYILYGKDKDGTSVVDRKEVYMDTKYGTYAHRRTESLDELMDNAAFNEISVRTDFTHGHAPTKVQDIDEEKVPGLHELRVAIQRFKDRHAAQLDYKPAQASETASVDADASSTGFDKLNLQSNIQSNLQSGSQCAVADKLPTSPYHIKHILTDLYKQQYILKDSHIQTEHQYNVNVHKGEHLHQAPAVNWDLYRFYPLGLYVGDIQRFSNPRIYSKKLTQWDVWAEPVEGELCIDYTNPEHIHELIHSYQDLSVQAEQDVESTAAALLRTLDFYASLADLSPARREIYELKKLGLHNEQIRLIMREKHGTAYNNNYISTIYKKNVCTEIAEAAKLHYKKFLCRDDDSMWKVCTCCGEAKLLDSREFMYKKRSSDGFSGCCKKCDKAKRDARNAKTVF